MGTVWNKLKDEDGPFSFLASGGDPCGGCCGRIPFGHTGGMLRSRRQRLHWARLTSFSTAHFHLNLHSASATRSHKWEHLRLLPSLQELHDLGRMHRLGYEGALPDPVRERFVLVQLGRCRSAARELDARPRLCRERVAVLFSIIFLLLLSLFSFLHHQHLKLSSSLLHRKNRSLYII